MNKIEIVDNVSKLALLLKSQGKSFAFAVNFDDGSGDEEFFSAMNGSPEQREDILGGLAEISFDMQSKS